jgi:hypothetical protein
MHEYSEVPNKRVTFFIIFRDFFLPTWPQTERVSDITEKLDF